MILPYKTEVARAFVQINIDEEEAIHIIVEDNGIGMPPEHSSSDGIGMGTLQGRVKALKGSIEIDSAPGEGTTVYVSV